MLTKTIVIFLNLTTSSCLNLAKLTVSQLDRTFFFYFCKIGHGNRTTLKKPMKLMDS